MFRVVNPFRDLKDGERFYKKGDVYPREGLEPTEERIRELLTARNRIGDPLIIEEKPKRTRTKK